MKILEIRDSKIDSNLLMIFTGVILSSSIEFIEDFIGRLILLFSYISNSSFIVRFYYSYAFQLLLILGLIYLFLTIKKAKINRENKAFIYLKNKHFILLGLTVIILVIVNRVLEYFMSDINYTFYKFSVEYNMSIINSGFYIFLNAVDKILPFLKGLLVIVIFFSLNKDVKNAHTANII